MDDLEKKVSLLISDYLIKSNRNYSQNLDHKAQANCILAMLSSDSLEGIFEFEDKNYSLDLKEYKRKLDAILNNRKEQSFSWNSYTKSIIFESVLNDYFSRLTNEIEASATARESWKLKQKVIDLQAQIEFGKPASDVTFLDKLNARINLPYLILLCLSIVLIGGLTLIGLTADMTVNVEFNIGEILGALLVGTGVAAAGVSYATRDRQSDNEQNE